jgi:hypothetical protein
MIVVDDILQIDLFDSILKQYGYNARGENGIVGRRYVGIEVLEHNY